MSVNGPNTFRGWLADNIGKVIGGIVTAIVLALLLDPITNLIRPPKPSAEVQAHQYSALVEQQIATVTVTVFNEGEVSADGCTAYWNVKFPSLPVEPSARSTSFDVPAGGQTTVNISQTMDSSGVAESRIAVQCASDEAGPPLDYVDVSEQVTVNPASFGSLDYDGEEIEPT